MESHHGNRSQHHHNRAQNLLHHANNPNSSNPTPPNVPHTLPLISQIPNYVPPPGAVLPQQLITTGTRKDCVRLRGLPYTAQVIHILDFLGDHAKNITPQGVHMVHNAQVNFVRLSKHVRLLKSFTRNLSNIPKYKNLCFRDSLRERHLYR